MLHVPQVNHVSVGVGDRHSGGYGIVTVGGSIIAYSAMWLAGDKFYD